MTVSTETIKQKILLEIEKLPDHKLSEVLDFVSFLLVKEDSQLPTPQSQPRTLDPQDNPLLQFIGVVSHGTLAQDIDKELYSL